MNIARSLMAAFALALATDLFTACWRGSDPQAQHATASAAAPGSGSSLSCPSSAHVASVVGFSVRVVMDTSSGGTVVCGYQAADAGGEGAFVSLTVEPADQADKRLEGVRAAAKTLLGQGSDADRIAIGERGYAYGSRSKGEAVAVSGGRVYYASIESTSQENLGDTKAMAIRLLRDLMR
jgi:hypothetical protein